MRRRGCEAVEHEGAKLYALESPLMKRAKNCRHGQTHPRAVLTDHEVELIRRLNDEGMTQKEIALRFEISKSQVSKIVRYLQR